MGIGFLESSGNGWDDNIYDNGISHGLGLGIGVGRCPIFESANLSSGWKVTATRSGKPGAIGKLNKSSSSQSAECLVLQSLRVQLMLFESFVCAVFFFVLCLLCCCLCLLGPFC